MADYKVTQTPAVIWRTTEEEIIRCDDGLPAHLAVIEGVGMGGYPRHWHRGAEVIYVKKGTMSVELEEQEVFLQEGEVLVIESGCRHAIHGRTDGKIQVLAVTFEDKKVAKIYPEFAGRKLCPSNGQKANDAYQKEIFLMQTLFDIWQSDDRYRLMRQEQALKELLYQLYSPAIQEEEQLEEAEEEWVREVAMYLTEHHGEAISTQQMADFVGYSREHFCRCFKRATGISFKQYLTELRLSYVAMELMSSQESIFRIALKHGFVDEKSFIAVFKKRFFVLPSQFRDKARKINHKTEVVRSQNVM